MHFRKYLYIKKTMKFHANAFYKLIVCLLFRSENSVRNGMGSSENIFETLD